VANKQYRLTEAEWNFISDMRSMEMDELLDIVIALRNEVRELEKKAEIIREREKEGWEAEYQAGKKRINHLRQFEQDLRKTWPHD
jgi:hypothetical protein